MITTETLPKWEQFRYVVKIDDKPIAKFCDEKKFSAYLVELRKVFK